MMCTSLNTHVYDFRLEQKMQTQQA